ncbi:hypothetical protein RIF29_20565 [Crotalaria pallida]|uniref:Uncharacterized protein n=1 Tax=Crotalaria pallida TaxID=3830 RepID=A0AAN9F5U0_CROPI
MGEVGDKISLIVSDESPKLIALQLAKVSTYKGITSATTYWNATKIFFNPQIPETLLLQQSAVCNTPTQTSGSSQLTGGSQGIIVAALTDPDSRKLIAEITTTAKV